MQSATLNISLADYTSMQDAIKEAQLEAARLREELVQAKMMDPSHTVENVTRFARDCLTITRFGIANMSPEVTRNWPYEVLRRVAQNIDVLPDHTTDDRDMAIDMLAFSRDCEVQELRRRGVEAPMAHG